MSYRKSGACAVLAVALATAVPAAAHGGTRAPACRAEAACYVQWADRDGHSYTQNSPDTNSCYPMVQGAVSGSNQAGRRVYLYKDRDCQGGAKAYVEPASSWADADNPYYSFGFVTGS
ncbi:hypothetical protein ACFP1Z_25915 [Streptomyces gamaensis]|uniref:Peptidase inhibitor family I36 n=1 Tax=Streptomyces gamaensis TaxID=1763542 RepID=A0ABW0Z977_9ACTN